MTAGENKDRLILFVIAFFIIVLVSLHIGVITPYWKITPDSTTYVVGGESIASGKGYLERGKPAPLFPPMTSLIFSFFILIFPKNYLVLNGVVTLFAFSSLLLFFFLFSRKELRDAWFTEAEVSANAKKVEILTEDGFRPEE